MNAFRIAVALVMSLAAGAVNAQPAGAGGPCATAGASAPGLAQGGCSGTGRHARWGQDYTPGWPMMNAQERQAHRDQLAGFTTYEECKAYMNRHHEEMVARAKERGRGMPAQPRHDACAPLKDKKASK